MVLRVSSSELFTKLLRDTVTDPDIREGVGVDIVVVDDIVFQD